MAAPERYIDVAAQAVFLWLTQDRCSPERDLIEHQLACAPEQAFAIDALSCAMNRPVAAIARLMFALNRCDALSVRTTPPPAPVASLGAGLEQALAGLTQSGGSVILADHCGLLLAQAGQNARDAEWVAAGLGDSMVFAAVSTLYFHGYPVTVHTAGPVSLKHPAWVTMARLLQKSAGALCVTATTP